MTMKAIFVLSISFLFLKPTPFLAQTQIPIGELQRNQGFSISGEVISVVGNQFILDDGTGQIIVDAGPRWYHQINISSGEEVTVIGDYDDEDFDAYTIIKGNGEVIEIRPSQGPPPWAGGRRK